MSYFSTTKRDFDRVVTRMNQLNSLSESQKAKSIAWEIVDNGLNLVGSVCALYMAGYAVPVIASVLGVQSAFVKDVLRRNVKTGVGRWSEANDFRGVSGGSYRQMTLTDYNSVFYKAKFYLDKVGSKAVDGLYRLNNVGSTLRDAGYWARQDLINIGSKALNVGVKGSLTMGGANLRGGGVGVPLLIAPFVFAGAYALTRIFESEYLKLREAMADPSKVDRETVEALVKYYDSMLFNKAYVTGLTDMQVYDLWNAYVKSVDALKVYLPSAGTKPFPWNWFPQWSGQDLSLDVAEQELDIELKKKQLAEQELSPYAYQSQTNLAYIDAEEARLANTWDKLDGDVKAKFLSNGISREQFLSYQRAANSGLGESVLKMMFPAFYPEEAVVDSSMGYEDFMTAVFDMDDTIEPLSAVDMLESEVSDVNSFSLAEFYGLFKRKPYKSRKRYRYQRR